MKRYHDAAILELNFKEDGIRNIYEDTGAMSNVSRSLDAFGGGAISVVPALSVINTKVMRWVVFAPTYFVDKKCTSC